MMAVVELDAVRTPLSTERGNALKPIMYIIVRIQSGQSDTQNYAHCQPWAAMVTKGGRSRL